MSIELAILALLLFLIASQFVYIFRQANPQKQDNETIAEIAKVKDSFHCEMQANRMEMQALVGQQFGLVFESIRANAKEQTEALKDFGRLFRENVQEFNAVQREKFQELVWKQEKMLASTEEKLEKMRETVDEKLHKTLEARLGQSFELVTKHLLEVQKGLGEMQHLATGVGDLKKVLTNVKSRGMLGEYQLEAILENILAPDQFATNVGFGRGSGERVEFAIKMPGHGDEGPVFLPLDAKFPQETYYRLLDAYEVGDKATIDLARLELFKAIKKSAIDISSRYIKPPFTTDFAVMFLPMESLYAEIIRDPGLAMMLQRDHKIVLTGPTTLAAMLNSLQMGFKTLAIQKRSSEVWHVLGAVKSEFSKFGDLISKAQKKISEAHHDLDELVGTRTRAIQRKLKDVEEYPVQEGKNLLD